MDEGISGWWKYGEGGGELMVIYRFYYAVCWLDLVGGAAYDRS